jgi:hypothetical protein
MENFKLLSF